MASLISQDEGSLTGFSCIYFAMGFRVAMEMLNLWTQRKGKPTV